MADDDDTSAGLTAESTGRPARRRASRNAGPPVEPVTTSPAEPTDPVDAPASTAVATAVTEAGVGTPEPDAGESTGAAPEPVAEDADEAPDARAGGRRALVGWILILVLAVALAAAAVALLIQRNHAAQRDEQRNAFVQTARQTVLNLTTIKPDTAKEDVDRILAGASGEFKSEFDGREDPFVGVVKQAGVTTVGKILESGFESQDGNTATVLVAARADVSTPDGTQNGPRDFRMRVTVTDDGGTMTASKVEFVP